MKRTKVACITQTLRFFNHDKETTEYAKRAIVQEYEKYKSQLERSGINDNLNMYINDHLRMYTSDYALI